MVEFDDCRATNFVVSRANMKVCRQNLKVPPALYRWGSNGNVLDTIATRYLFVQLNPEIIQFPSYVSKLDSWKFRFSLFLPLCLLRRDLSFKIYLFWHCWKTIKVFIKQRRSLPFICHISTITCKDDSNNVSNGNLEPDLQVCKNCKCAKTESVETTAPPHQPYKRN